MFDINRSRVHTPDPVRSVIGFVQEIWTASDGLKPTIIIISEIFEPGYGQDLRKSLNQVRPGSFEAVLRSQEYI